MLKKAISAWMPTLVLYGSLLHAADTQGSLCKGENVVAYTIEEKFPKFVKILSVATNDKALQMSLQSKFKKIYYNPFHVHEAVKLYEDLQLDAINVSSVLQNIRKPEVFYSKLSLYEKSQYSMSQLSQLKREEEEYRLKIKKAMQIAKNTRIFNPFRENGFLIELIKLNVIFAKDDEVKKIIFDVLKMNKLENIVASTIERNDFVTEMFKLSLRDSGIDYYYKDSTIQEKDLIVKDTLLSNVNKNDVTGKFMFYVFNGEDPLKNLSPKERQFAKRMLQEYLSLCMFPAYEIPAYDMELFKKVGSVLDKTPLQKALDIFVLSHIFPEKKSELYALYQVIWPRSEKFLEFLEVWMYERLKKTTDIDIKMLFPFFEDSSVKSIEAFLPTIVPKLRFELYDAGNFKDVYILTEKIMLSDIGSSKERTHIKKLYAKSAIALQRHFQKQGNARENYRIFEKTKDILQKR